MIQVTAINGMGAISESGGTYTTTGMEANDHMHISEDFVRNPGVVSISDGDYKVTQSDTPGKSVKVASGRAYVLNSDYAISSLSEQKFWRCKADVAEDVAISDNTSGNPRIDIICIKVDTTATPDDEATNVASLVVIEGIPGATPSIPATPDNHLKLAEVAVANGFSSVVNANITDTRSEVTIADNAGGWISPNETWTYLSSTKITVPSGAVSRYRKGMPWKLTANSVELQGYIIGVADTVLTVVGNTLTNHVFSNNYYALSGTVPLGFDDWFRYTPTYTCEGSMTYTSTSNRLSRFRISGNTVFFELDVAGTIGGSVSTGIYVTLPVAPYSNYGRPALTVYDTTSIGVGYGIFSKTNSNILVRKSDTSNWSAGASRLVCLNLVYSF